MSKTKDFETVPLRLPTTLDETVTHLANTLGKSKQDTMRLCMELGAKWIELNGYDPTREITRLSAMDTMLDIIATATEQITSRDQKLTEITAALTRILATLEPSTPLHRDLKPAHLHLNEDSQTPETIDFGQRQPVTYKPTRKTKPKGSH